MTLEFIDLRDEETRQAYIRNSPEPRNGTPVIPIIVPLTTQEELPPIERNRVRRIRNTDREEQQPKRTYQKITLVQKQELIKLFQEHGDGWDSTQYSTKLGIKKKEWKNSLFLLRKGESILPKGHYSRKSRTQPFQVLVEKSIKMDSTIPVKQIQNIIAKKEKMALGETEIEYTEEDLTNPEFINSKSIELSDDEIKLLAPSISSIRHFLKGETGSNEERNIPMFSFKKETIRGFVANTEENKNQKDRSYPKIKKLYCRGAKWVCIDETSWSVANTTTYGWSKKGEKCFISKSRNGIRLTSVCAIDSDGFSYCNIVAGSNTKECFESYFKRLMNIYDSQNRKCVFWCDNCSIHNSMNEMVEATQHLVIYNAAYSPELNPIENIFGIWKIKTEKQIREWVSLQDLIEKIGNSFESIESHVIAKTMESVRNEK